MRRDDHALDLEERRRVGHSETDEADAVDATRPSSGRRSRSAALAS
jgi:hypothetical protein